MVSLRLPFLGPLARLHALILCAITLLFYRAFLNLRFGEPLLCTPDSRGFRYFCGFRD